MIQNLYILNPSGICIYSYEFQKKAFVDEQLLSGFLSAITMFAQEAFRTGLQAIQIRSGQKMIFYLEQIHKLMFCAIANEQDNNRLLETLLKEIAQEFVFKMSKILISGEDSRIDQYKQFDPFLTQITKNKEKSRNFKTMMLGLLEGILIIAGLAQFSNFINAWLLSFLTFNVMLIWFLLILTLELTLCAFVAGYTAGNPKFGVPNGLLFFLFLNWIVSFDPEMYIGFLLIAPFVLIACISAGYYGGLTCDRRKLYPLK